MSGIKEHFDRLVALRDQAAVKVTAILDKAEGEGREYLTPDETTEFKQRTAHIKELDELITEQRGELERSGKLDADAARVRGASSVPGGPSSDRETWARSAAQALRSASGGDANTRAVISGSVDVPSLVLPQVVATPHPVRLIDLFTNRQQIESTAYSYFRQVARNNLAAPVADGAEKPTSTLTVQQIEDRARVVAHLSEPLPFRIWQDDAAIVQWLSSEMGAGVLDALEAQAISGDGTGEDMTGVLTVAGTTAVPFDTDVVTTLRSAVTALQVLGETPTGWALHPADAQAVDLLRWNAAGGFLTGGYEHDNRTGVSGSSDNVFSTIPRVISPSVPQGTAVLGDWAQLKLFVREGVRIDVDASGELFRTNRVQLRAEARVGVGVLRPQAFAKTPSRRDAVADDGVTAVRDGSSWRWQWRAPWAVVQTGTTTHKTQRAALAAGRRWLKAQQ